MLLKKTVLFWISGLVSISSFMFLGISGYNHIYKEDAQVSKGLIADGDILEQYEEEENVIRNISIDLYQEADKKNKLAELETVRKIINRFGEKGYVAVDSRNQINMTKAETVLEFCEKVDGQTEAEITIFEINYWGGIVRYDLHTENGKVYIFRSYYKYENGDIQRKTIGHYLANSWNYTPEGYLMFSGTMLSDEMYVLTMSPMKDRAALRVLPLDEKYRELRRKYLDPIGFEQNNMFILNWSEDDFGDLDFYDMYDILYPIEEGCDSPYVADDDLSVSAVYRIPKDEFESVIMNYFKIDSTMLQSKTIYDSENFFYEYKPRGFREVEYPEYPYSEVVGFTKNGDGTITLTANVVFPYEGNSKVYAHEVVIRPLGNGKMQYVSNRIIPNKKNYKETWHISRLTLREWEELYGGEK